jgi:hypothetical protein
MATAFLLGWLYDATQSILLCVLFHAAANTTEAMGLTTLDAPAAVVVATTGVKLAIGIRLVLCTVDRRAETRQAT